MRMFFVAVFYSWSLFVVKKEEEEEKEEVKR